MLVMTSSSNMRRSTSQDVRVLLASRYAGRCAWSNSAPAMRQQRTTPPLALRVGHDGEDGEEGEVSNGDSLTRHGSLPSTRPVREVACTIATSPL
jgi:hypothetical protein